MAKFLTLWRLSPTAPWPTDPAEIIKLNEMLFAGTDSLLQTGVLKEHGFFLDGASGYTIMETESTEVLRAAQVLSPFIEVVKVEEIVSYESGKEIVRGAWKNALLARRILDKG